ncbi:MAG TPA: hypothetical protein VFL91_29210 [Thermomicrobiales bacterium]|nr:hypothetical protein [Thermomicrobiales bacterium]
MLKGMHLTLLIGPAVPVPVPRVVLDALTAVEVTTSAGSASGFQLTFTLSNRSPLETLFLLSGGAAIPLIRVIIVVTLNGMPEVLMDGVMTNHQIAPGGDGGHATLTVTGEDLTRVMDYIDFSGVPYPAMPVEARVALIVAKYAAFGLAPLVVPSVLVDVPIPVDRIPRQAGTDLAYVRQLADEAGYVFYVEPGPAPGASLAYWGPEIKVGAPQPALNLDMDAYTNVESLTFTFDNTARALPVLFVQNQATKVPIPIPVPDVGLLDPPLGLIPPIPNRIEPITGLAKLSPIQAALRGLARAARSSDAVTGTGTLDVLRYGRILKARRLVGVRGAGMAFDGLYYVKSVTHGIKRGEFKQRFTLSRNGLVSTLPRVPV